MSHPPGATYVLIHGDVGWYWHLVGAELRENGHDVVVMDLPVDDDSAGLSDYADVVVKAIGNQNDLAQGTGFSGPRVLDTFALIYSQSNLRQAVMTDPGGAEQGDATFGSARIRIP